jgi:signal transduction histidine kinase
MAGRRIQIAGYLGVLALCFAVGLLAGWNRLARRVDHQTYDLLTGTLSAAEPAEAVIVAIDEPTLRARGEVPNLRRILAETLEEILPARPRAVAVDVILGGAADPGVDQRLEAALRAAPNLILGCLVDSAGQWEDPAPRFRELASGIGHVHYEADRSDGVTRQLALELVHGGTRKWAMALEALRVAYQSGILESPEDLEVAGIRIPAARREGARAIYIRYVAPGAIPVISALELARRRDQLHGRTVFLGVTALSAANDRLKIPSGETLAGVMVHAQAYETLRRGRFLSDASTTSVFLVCLGLAVAVGVAFLFLSGWAAYGVVSPLLALSLYLPRLFLGWDIVFPLVAPAAVAWFCATGAATYQHFVVRRALRRTESEKARYQQAIHWAAHEMRTPLTAIQGSSELMSRYRLPEDKRGQLSEMIHAESKRLARIIQTFLDVERLAEGQMELKRAPFPVAELVETCLARVAPLAERKSIRVCVESPLEGILTGDRELMEYALYNLLTNAVKYSPAETTVRVRYERRGSELRLAVEDEGIGMDAKELKKIFRKFYRTQRAEASGEAGTGIGLSIVEQIVTHHGGRIEVTSAPGKGSCFTIVLTAE